MSTGESTAAASHAGHAAGGLAGLSLGALGVVYGDIGTSPLYAIRETFDHHPALVLDEANVLGVLSIIFWSLVVVVSVKYLAFVMRADNGGEGGILALTALLPRAKRVGPAGGAAGTLLLFGLFGTALLYGDGMITPAISVLSAVEGLKVATDAFDPYIIPLAVGILVGVFAVQRLGTGKVGNVFGPVMVVWFSVLAVLGIGEIVQEPGVLAAVNPLHGVRFFSRNPWEGFLALGSMFLCVTGGEALYADMGHFGRKPIQASWFAFVFPALTLTYFGQGALLIGDPAAIESPLYLMAPEWAVVPLVVLATAATVIASQALISGAFSLTVQAIQLGYAPRLRVDHTSHTQRGQIYVPSVNWVLMLACVALVLGFRSSTNLAAAYGLAVTATMVVTALIFAYVARHHWGWGWPVVGALSAVFLTVDGAFFAANLFKIPDGGWFPLVVGLILLVLLTTWKRGRELVGERLQRGRMPLGEFVAGLAAEPLARAPGVAVFMFSEPGATPPALATNVRLNRVLHERVLVASVVTSDRPRVPPAERVEVNELGEGFAQVSLHYGFMEEPTVGLDLPPALGLDPARTVYFLGRETVLSTSRVGMAPWRERLFALLTRNAANAARFFDLPPDRVFEVGMHVDI
ncbi:MAG: potassium transporter Kup [Acidimicrobiales bacterium]